MTFSKKLSYKMVTEQSSALRLASKAEYTYDLLPIGTT